MGTRLMSGVLFFNLTLVNSKRGFGQLWNGPMKLDQLSDRVDSRGMIRFTWNGGHATRLDHNQHFTRTKLKWVSRYQEISLSQLNILLTCLLLGLLGSEKFNYVPTRPLAFSTCCYMLFLQSIENTSWKVLAYGIYARVVDVPGIERVSAANE